MPKYKLSPEERAAKAARKEKIRELMSEMQVKDMNDINSMFKEMVGDILRTDLKQSSMRSLVTANMIIATRTPQTVGMVIVQRR